MFSVHMSKSMSMSTFYLFLFCSFCPPPFVSKRPTGPVEFQQDWKVGCKLQTIRQQRGVQDPDWVCKKRRTSTRRPLDSRDRCPFSAIVTIGRREGSIFNEWFFIQGEALHTGHYPPRADALTKPTRLYSKEELQAVHDVLASYSGEGVAKSLYYYRTGEILSRSTCDWLKVFFFLTLSLSSSCLCPCRYLVFVLVYHIFRLSYIFQVLFDQLLVAMLGLSLVDFYVFLVCLHLLTPGDAR
jgi:hypothetical protein